MTSHRHQRRAALPGAGYTRPSSLDATGLVVTVFGESGGVEGTFDFTPLPGSIELRRAFAAALDRKSGPAATWRSRETCRNGYWALRSFLEYLAARDDTPSTAAEIGTAIWAAWRLSLPHNHTARNRLAEPISQSIGGVRVFTFASCPAVGSALASGEKASVAQAIPTPESAICLTVVPFVWVMSERVHVLGGRWPCRNRSRRV